MMAWIKTPVDLKISAAHIDVWRTSLRLPERKVTAFADTLSDEEIKRADKFKIPAKYCEYVITRGLLRRSLALVLDKDPKEFQFDYTKLQKPFLDEGAVSFNVSHSHDFALVAIGLDRNIGVDVEKIRKNVECEKLAKRFFSAAEHAAMMKVPKQERMRVFYTIWTRKEAFVKATGKGIAFGLSEFDVSIQPDGPAELIRTRWDPAAVSRWSMENIDVDINYMATLAADGEKFGLRTWSL